MKKWMVAEFFVVVAFAIGFWMGKSMNSDEDYERYYERAEKAWLKAQDADNPPVTLDEPDDKRLRKVRALYRETFEKYPDSPWADDAIYQLASRIARYEEEQFALFRRLINNYPDSEWADEALYTIAVAQYRIAEEKKQGLTPESADAHYDRAFVLFDQLTQDYRGSLLAKESRFSKAMCYYGKGNWSRALEAFDELREEFRDNELIHSIVYNTGNIFFEKQEYEKARIEFQNVVDSGHPELAPLAQLGIAQTFFARGDYEKASEGYQQVIDRYPNTKVAEDAHFYVGRAYERAEKYDDAIAQIEEAINNYPRNSNSTNYQFYVAQIYYLNSDKEGAIEAYRKVADNATFDYDPRRSAQYEIGNIYEEKGEIMSAIEEYQKLLKNFPDPHNYPGHRSNSVNENYLQKLQEKSQTGRL